MYLQKVVDEYYPGASIFESMDVWSLPKHKKNQIKQICDSQEYFAQLKKDGFWYEYSKSKTGEAYLFSRGESVKTGLPVESIQKVPHIKKIFEALPNDTVIIGEIYYPGKNSDEVKTIMGCLPKKAITRQKEKGYIHFYLHDILKFNGEDLTSLGALERYSKLQSIVQDYNLLNNEYVELAETVLEDLYNFLMQAFKDGEEGTVLKLKTAPYAEGKRPAWQTIKWKREDEVDVVCIGFEDATMEYDGISGEAWKYWGILHNIARPGEEPNWILEDKIEGKPINIIDPDYNTIPLTKPFFYGWKTSIVIGLFTESGKLLPIGKVSSGLTDDLRAKFAASPQDYIGKTLSCKCMEVTENSLRHPIFIKFRDDKPAKKCTFKSVFG